MPSSICTGYFTHGFRHHLLSAIPLETCEKTTPVKSWNVVNLLQRCQPLNNFRSEASNTTSNVDQNSSAASGFLVVKTKKKVTAHAACLKISTGLSNFKHRVNYEANQA